MEKYNKIETLFEFDLKTKKFIHGKFFNHTVELLKDYQWLFSEKVDGTNFRLNWDGYNMRYAGRTDTSEFSADQKEYIESNIATPEMEQALEHKFKDKEVTIFGELHGKNIQKVGKLYSEDYQFKVFGMKFPISEKPLKRKYLSRLSVVTIAKSLGFDVVPYVFKGTIAEAMEYVNRTEKSTFSEAPLEGLVGIPEGDLLDCNGEKIIIKIKRRDIKES